MRIRSVVVAVAAVAMCAAPLLPARTAHAASPGYTVLADQVFTARNLGPNHDTSCPVSYDLYTPSPVPAANTAPAILFTNGFGGSKADGAAMAAYFAPKGYVVLSYSGLGFGASGCQIELDDPDWDGRAATQLIDYLGTLAPVLKDGPDDPRVGMFGGSYGGAIQLATASLTPKLDAIVPQITWNDLAYSLTPNNDSPALQWTDSPPGAPKTEWTDLFFALGLSQPIQHLSNNTLLPTTLGGCPGFDGAVCAANATSATQGYASPSTVSLLRHASMVAYGSTVHIPTMLMQGQGDTLFTIDEAVANRAKIMANGAPVKLVLQSWGHSFSGYPGDNTDFADPTHPTYDERLVQQWFDHYLKGLPVDTGPAVEYYRDWVQRGADAQLSYGSSSGWPLAPMTDYGLSGSADLVPLAVSGRSARAAVAAGSSTFASAPAPPGGSYSETSAVQYSNAQVASIPASDPPGTFASWSTAPLARDTDLAGIPTLRMTLAAAAPVVAGNPATMPVIFAKLYDVDPAGTTSLLFPRLVSPTRFGDLSRQVTVTLPGVVHRFPAGHTIRLTLASGDLAYLNSRTPNVYTVSTSPDQPSVLSLPLLSGGTVPTATAPTTNPGATASPSTGLANTAAASTPGGIAAGVVTLGALIAAAGRRRRHGAAGSSTASLSHPSL